MKYEGMRWFKCDLQVQTPEDSKNWADTDLRLGEPRDKQRVKEIARAYLRRCHEEELEVIGVTDHNFSAKRDSRDWFLTHLIEENVQVAAQVNRDPLIIFPGFEVDIGYHVLCLFEPVSEGRALQRVNDTLTSLGLRPGDRVADQGSVAPLYNRGHKSLVGLLEEVQVREKGIAIAAHAFEESGIAREGRDAMDFCNPDLLCCEVTAELLKGREQDVIGNQMPSWKRERPIATVMSSDAKSIKKGPDGKPLPNSLGYRWTWIKMSKPSIEALRQAFLDPESRIRRMGPRPEAKHPRIHSLSCTRAAFLGDQEIVFSPHLTCIIGGRGSGKSTLFEYLRFCLRQEKAEGARSQVERIGGTLESSSRLDLRFRSTSTAGEELEDSILYVKDGRPAQIVSREVSNAATVFEGYGVTIFSQDELTEVARNPRIFLQVLDQLLGKELADLRTEIANKSSEITTLFAKRRQLEMSREQERGLEQEIAELGRKVQARATLRPFQEKHRLASEAKLHLERAMDQLRNVEERIEALAEEAQEAPVWGNAIETWSEPLFFGELEQKLAALHQMAATELRKLKATLAQGRESLIGPESVWLRVRTGLEGSSKAFFDSCVDHGLKPDELNRMMEVDRQLPAKQQILDALRRTNLAEAAAVDQLPTKLAELAELWHSETRLRKEGATRLTSHPAIPKTLDGKSTINIIVDESGDLQEFEKLWQKLAPTDLRTRLARSWFQLGQEAFRRFRLNRCSSPWEEVEAWLVKPSLFPSGPSAATLDDLQSHLTSRRPEWEELRLCKVPDAVDAILYRKDGDEAGRLQNRDLSDGQRNTLLLHLLLLTESDGPILVDQPESEVDSRFLYDQLVPLVRRIKEERQIVFVTHNANLPVNADAELVYALDAVPAEENRIRGVHITQGGLDRKEVRDAVLDIMEGSEEAFRRRREKYHF